MIDLVYSEADVEACSAAVPPISTTVLHGTHGGTAIPVTGTTASPKDNLKIDSDVADLAVDSAPLFLSSFIASLGLLVAKQNCLTVFSAAVVMVLAFLAAGSA